MKQEILDYYAALNIPVSKMINVGITRRNLTAAAVKTAAAEIYEEIKSGKLKISDIRIAWEIFARAKTVKIENDAKESQVIKELKKEIAYLRLPWWKKWRMSL
jgi:hypothetical protein